MLINSFKSSWIFLTALTFIFFITFVVFPGTTNDTSLQFMKGMQNYDSWYFLIMVMIFNVLDTIGRYMGGTPKLMLSDYVVVALSYSRSIFVLTFMLIAFNIPPSWLFGINADWFKIINMCLFSISNGYISTMLAIKAPSRAHDDSKEQVGLFVGISITFGILIGSLVAIGVG